MGVEQWEFRSGSLEVESHHTLADLKQMIEDKYGISFERIRYLRYGTLNERNRQRWDFDRL